ncbi:hypothetical protein C9374_001984 [Naegleria lovaniensis]|uniref:Uncharacterized protein n=1 Tax=Naegleria lovaniensis TaxID=51637 RepID=A0AA88KMG4_NAELO|nr:uncharacterized protein C9374_001984 [Naegleria lovaniensis]KAG2386949.1 hypothetical protein C9374_001984 [Naegleria lovaniensis]
MPSKEKSSSRSSSSSKKKKKKSESKNSAPSNDPSSQNIQSNQNLVTAQQNYDIHKFNFMTTLNINNHVYDKQLTELQFIINSKLIPTKQSLLSQLYKIQSKMTMVKKAKDKLLNEYKIQMETLFNNLNMQESNKMLILKQDETSVLNQLQTIQNFVNRVGNELSSGKENIPVATDFSSFNDISSLLEKQIIYQINIYHSR